MMIDKILQFNRAFVARHGYKPFITDKYPAMGLAVLSCMDTRLTELLPQALGLRNGDAKIIRNAGGLILSETDSSIRSLLVAIYELGVGEVMVVHHSTCGACHMSYAGFRPHMLERGIPASTLAAWEAKGIEAWLEGFHDTEESVRQTVAAVREHPLVPKDVVVRGFIIDSVTGALTEIDCPESPVSSDGPEADAVARVSAMSQAFDRVEAQVRRVQDGSLPVEALSDLNEDILALDQYQRSGLWLQDYEADEAGTFTCTAVRRSVLSQDGLYNLLLNIDALRSGQ